jgi:glycerol kinase
LCYITYGGKAVKASRLFAGHEHEQQAKRLAAHFNKPQGHYTTVFYDGNLVKRLQTIHAIQQLDAGTAMVQQSVFEKRAMENFKTYEEAYHQLIYDIMVQQVRSTKLVWSGTPVKQIFVDGGFGGNGVYMNMLASAFPHINVCAAELGQASAIGAAMAIHKSWNGKPVPENIIRLKRYAARKDLKE